MSTTEMETKLAQLQEWEQIIAEATAEAKAIREEITDVMLRCEVEEMICGRFICRYTSILSSRFDTKRFKEVFGEEVYKSFTREVPSRRFTVST